MSFDNNIQFIVESWANYHLIIESQKLMNSLILAEMSAIFLSNGNIRHADAMGHVRYSSWKLGGILIC